MSDFEVGSAKLKNSASDINGINNTIKSLKQQLDKCDSVLQSCMPSKSYSGIKRSLSVASKSLQQQSINLNHLASGLEKSASLYSRTEKGISSQKVTIGKTTDIKKAADQKNYSELIKYVLAGGISSTALLEQIKADGKGALNAVDIIAELYEKYYDKKLTETEKELYKSFYKIVLGKTPIKDIPDMFKVIDKIHKGDYGGALGYLVDKAGMALDSDGNISYTGLKIKAIGKTIDLVLGKDSYIIANDDKYKAKAESSLRHGDILGFVWNGGGDFIQTVGKGTVDVSCQLVSDTIDAYISQSTGGLLTLTTVNTMLNDTIGTSPGHIFNACTKVVSDATDFYIDKGGDFLGALAKQSYSDLAEFGDLVGKAGKGISKASGGIVSAIKGWF